MKYTVNYDSGLPTYFLPLDIKHRNKISWLIKATHVKEIDVEIIQEEITKYKYFYITLAVPEDMPKSWWISWGQTPIVDLYYNNGEYSFVYAVNEDEE